MKTNKFRSIWMMLVMVLGTVVSFSSCSKDEENVPPQSTLVSSITLDKNSCSLCEGETLTLTATVLPDDATDKAVEWKSGNEAVATVSAEGVVTAKAVGTAIITCTAKDASGVKAECMVTVRKTPNVAYAHVIDLGLSVMWADMNVGATTPEGYGDFFAWGETETKEAFYINTYKWIDAAGKLTKYCTNSRYGTIDNKTTLDPEDDAATVNWGGDWRTPSYAELVELITACTWTQTSQNGVNGYKVTGPNGNSIFLPAAGYHQSGSLHYVGSRGLYMSRSLVSGYSSDLEIKQMGFTLGEYAETYMSEEIRYGSFSVRPVCPKSSQLVPVNSISLDKSSCILNEGESITLVPTISPDNATEKSVSWASSSTHYATVSPEGVVTANNVGTASIYCIAKDGSGVMAECTIHVKEAQKIGNAIDLGLSVKWADMNLGAETPEGDGKYYAWGCATDWGWDAASSWYDYKWSNGGENSMIKYCTDSRYGTVDNKTTLDPEDDAATYNWGGNWRMPTSAEQEELLTKCTWEKTSQNGVNGYKVTAPNGNSIFLPAAGVIDRGMIMYKGSLGDYWSSTLNEDNRYACDVYFWGSNPAIDKSTRYQMKAIRAVCP